MKNSAELLMNAISKKDISFESAHEILANEICGDFQNPVPFDVTTDGVLVTLEGCWEEEKQAFMAELGVESHQELEIALDYILIKKLSE